MILLSCCSKRESISSTVAATLFFDSYDKSNLILILTPNKQGFWSRFFSLLFSSPSNKTSTSGEDILIKDTNNISGI
jgi:hypothetical protein